MINGRLNKKFDFAAIIGITMFKRLNNNIKIISEKLVTLLCNLILKIENT